MRASTGHGVAEPRRLARLARALCTALLVWSAVSEGRAHAASGDEEPAGYRAAIDEAVQEFGANRFEEARSLFARAHELHPNARTHRGLGLVEFELRNYGRSIVELEAALASPVKPLSPALRGETERVLARANSFVARVTIDARPADARVIVDGVLAELPASRTLMLPVGDHTLEVQADGFVAERRRVSVTGGEQKTLSVMLAASALMLPGQDAEPRRWYQSPWLWAGVGVVVAGAAVGLGVGLTRDERTPEPYGGTINMVLGGP
ncbi:MAG TPA: PEGA domain-containing protein [Polyangiales bacterium]